MRGAASPTSPSSTRSDRAQLPLAGQRIYGCDDCLAVCPWNKFAQAGREQSCPRATLRSPQLVDLAPRRRGVPQIFREITGQAHRPRPFVRNVLIAIGNSGDAALAGEAERLLADASPLVRGAAVWALARLLPRERFVTIAAAERPRERDTLVDDEWSAALTPAAI
jgi:epoxyqueuosine reductase